MKRLKVHPAALKPQMRVFVCPCCGTKVTMPKVMGRSHAGHIKTAWCFVCKTEQDMLQVE